MKYKVIILFFIIISSSIFTVNFYRHQQILENPNKYLLCGGVGGSERFNYEYERLKRDISAEHYHVTICDYGYVALINSSSGYIYRVKDLSVEEDDYVLDNERLLTIEWDINFGKKKVCFYKPTPYSYEDIKNYYKIKTKSEYAEIYNKEKNRVSKLNCL